MDVIRTKIIRMMITGAAMMCATAATYAAVPLPVGWYVHGSVGATKINGASYGAGTKVSSGGPSLGFDVGYKFSPFFGSEIGYNRYSTAKIKSQFNNIQGKNKLTSVDIAGKAILPFSTTGIDLYAKLGWVLLHSALSGSFSGSHNTSGLYIGAGASYSFTPCVSVHGQWARANGDNKAGNVDFYSVGLGYIFT